MTHLENLATFLDEMWYADHIAHAEYTNSFCKRTPGLIRMRGEGRIIEMLVAEMIAQ